MPIEGVSRRLSGHHLELWLGISETRLWNLGGSALSAFRQLLVSPSANERCKGDENILRDASPG